MLKKLKMQKLRRIMEVAKETESTPWLDPSVAGAEGLRHHHALALEELRGLLEEVDQEARIELLALAYLGRGDFQKLPNAN